eukprot:1331532-Pyramimonas_sp.AAC.1
MSSSVAGARATLLLALLLSPLHAAVHKRGSNAPSRSSGRARSPDSADRTQGETSRASYQSRVEP